MKQIKKEEVVKLVDKANKSLDKVGGLWSKAKSQIQEKLNKEKEESKKDD